MPSIIEQLRAEIARMEAQGVNPSLLKAKLLELEQKADESQRQLEDRQARERKEIGL